MATTKNDSPNKDIDAMIREMRRDFDKLPPDVKINTIKVAIAWEKAKKDIKDSDDGEFFKDDE